MPQVRSVLAVEFWMLEIVTVMSIPGKLVHGHSVLPCLLPVKSRWSPPPPSILMQGKWMMNVKASLVHVYCQPVQVQSQQQGEEEEVGIKFFYCHSSLLCLLFFFLCMSFLCM